MKRSYNLSILRLFKKHSVSFLESDTFRKAIPELVTGSTNPSFKKTKSEILSVVNEKFKSVSPVSSKVYGRLLSHRLDFSPPHWFGHLLWMALIAETGPAQRVTDPYRVGGLPFVTDVLTSIEDLLAAPTDTFGDKYASENALLEQ
ncbi:hypothetical protein CROQUDRAFT_107183 [Cronartium quercuum f. sp. fusiforme G11]|uniref:Uncharacterized protein n=1 Tax=Cronartium quercuum f. sp. fusiforme G11 TaxID=708437 RepID=A0A9P6NMX6_9BASI|nr:hypothetical protein CROQUDRAFT_107183 [Cronartium quercuum f. sp. fusiforme G11]